MLKERQDAWTDENDLLLAETVLRHVREGSTQLNAFEEVGDVLNRTSAACGFRWNAVVRHRYEQALQVAKKFRKERMRALGVENAKKKLLYTPPTPSLDIVETAEEAIQEIEFDPNLNGAMLAEAHNSAAENLNTYLSEISEEPYIHVQQKTHVVTQAKTLSINEVIQFLQNYKGSDHRLTALQHENERLRSENKQLRAQNEQLEHKVSSLEHETVTIQEDYETIMKIMNRARKMVLFDEDDSNGTSFRMDRNGNLERLAE